MHQRIIVIVKVSRGLVIILELKVLVQPLAHVLPDDLDVLVPVGARVLVVEAQGVHDLVHGQARGAETLAVLLCRLLKRQLLSLVLSTNVGPAPGSNLDIFSDSLGEIITRDESCVGGNVYSLSGLRPTLQT